MTARVIHRRTTSRLSNAVFCLLLSVLAKLYVSFCIFVSKWRQLDTQEMPVSCKNRRRKWRMWRAKCIDDLLFGKAQKHPRPLVFIGGLLRVALVVPFDFLLQNFARLYVCPSSQSYWSYLKDFRLACLFPLMSKKRCHCKTFTRFNFVV